MLITLIAEYKLIEKKLEEVRSIIDSKGSQPNRPNVGSFSPSYSLDKAVKFSLLLCNREIRKAASLIEISLGLQHSNSNRIFLFDLNLDLLLDLSFYSQEL